MKLYKRNETWWFDVTIDGVRIRRSTKSTDREEAELYANEVVRTVRLTKLGLLDGEREPSSTKSPSLADFAVEYVQHMEANFAKKSASAARTALNSLRDSLNSDTLLRDITVLDVERWKTSLLGSRSSNTVSIYFRCLHAAFNRAKRWEYVELNPFNKAEKPREDRKEGVRYLSGEEIGILRDAVRGEDPRFEMMLSFYLYTGMRRNELIHLEWSDIDAVERQIAVESYKPKWDHRTKNRRSRQIPICDKLMELIQSLEAERDSDAKLREIPLVFPVYRPGKDNSISAHDRPFTGHAVTRKLSRLVTELNLDKTYTIHSLRHTFASRLVQHGTSLYIVGRLLGHTSPEVTKIYAFLAPKTYDWAVNELDFDAPGETKRVAQKVGPMGTEHEIQHLRSENEKLRRQEVA